MQELAKLTDKLTVEIQNNDHGAPCVQVCRADGTPTGLAFHGVPGGHEFTSFILGLYNAAGPGQPLDADVRAAIHSLGQKNMKVLVSLNCTMCPELVTAAQRIAAENKNITAEVFDINHFPELRETYNVMSVPCLILNDGETVTFGKKNIRQLLDILK
jgi:thioredoxin reductase (NADPH)